MITSSELETAVNAIESTVLGSILGAPTTLVQGVDPEAAALGQQLGSATGQRGLHGMAGGISVLSRSQEAAGPGAVAGMVRYLVNRHAIEVQLRRQQDPSKITPRKIVEDHQNTIKTAELILALKRVPGSWTRTEDLIADLVRNLEAGLGARDGWGYSLDSAADPEVATLPTAFAVQALAAHGVDVRHHVTFLMRVLEDQSPIQTDVSVKSFALYVLCFLPGITDDARATYKKVLDRLWDQLSPLLRQDLESNIEYFIDGHYEYVRVPWQLYLIACAAHLSPYRRFAALPAQRRLSAIVLSVSARGGLVYPHSGTALSTRTNAILHDVLGVIIAEMKHRRFLRVFSALDTGVRFLRSRAVLMVARIAVGIFVVWTIILWVTPGESTGEDLAPNFVATILLLVFATQGRRDDR